MEVPLPWERLLWTGRSLSPRRERYALTDFRFVHHGGGNTDEILLQDIGDIQRTESPLDRIAGTSTLAVYARDRRRKPIVVRRIRRGHQLAALLDLLSSDPRASLDAEAVRTVLSWKPGLDRREPGFYRAAFAGLGAATIVFIAAAMSLHGKAAAVAYPSDDAIYPGGEKKDRAEIVRFMETDVLPWARQALGPIAGGADRVSCATCHGADADARAWRMPSVAALPLPDVAERGWETYGGTMDAQTRNAIYGYIAEADNQTKAAYMREVVMPGMARLLHRPVYNFTQPYDYNRTRLAFGCYHCHQVK